MQGLTSSQKAVKVLKLYEGYILFTEKSELHKGSQSGISARHFAKGEFGVAQRVLSSLLRCHQPFHNNLATRLWELQII